MCYSKEVQAATGLTIWALSLYYYWSYRIRFQAIEKPWLLPFLRHVIIAFLLIGSHQIFEFLSLVTGNVSIYKTGLLLSLSSMYFFLRSLEVLLNRSVHSSLVLAVVGVVAIHLLRTPMTFSAEKFYLHHESAFFWASAWMGLFIYFHVCALNSRATMKSDFSKKAVLFYLLATLDISFLLSVLYVLWGYSQFSMNVCTSSPSVWCTFFVIQLFALPFFLSTVPKLIERPQLPNKQTVRRTIIFSIISIGILLLLIALLPFFHCLTTKFVFP